MTTSRTAPTLSWWVIRGSIAMAALAALSLAVTVLSAQRCLNSAGEVVVRGDGENLVAKVVADLGTAPGLPTEADLQQILSKHEAEGLRFVALIERKDRHPLIRAGTNEIHQRAAYVGELQREGRRFKLVAHLAPPWDAAHEGPAMLADSDSRPYLVIEFEPPVIDRLQRDLARIAVVAMIAAAVMLAFALAWTRAMARLAEIQIQGQQQQRLVALGRASSVIAHELRNPLAVLKGHAQLLLEDLSGPSRDNAARVVQGAERLERLTNVLLDFVRDGPLDVRATTAHELIDRAISEPTSRRVRVDVTGAPLTLQLDVERTALALRNLVENGVEASESAAELVEVRIAGAHAEVVIEVRDHGAGLPSEVERQLFEPFVTTKVRGTGLGLSIARRIAEQHHGSLTGHTHEGGGAVFRMILPQAAQPA